MSIWVIEKVFMIGDPVPIASPPYSDEKQADMEVANLRRIYGGDYRAVEYVRKDSTTKGAGHEED